MMDCAVLPVRVGDCFDGGVAVVVVVVVVWAIDHVAGCRSSLSCSYTFSVCGPCHGMIGCLQMSAIPICLLFSICRWCYHLLTPQMCKLCLFFMIANIYRSDLTLLYVIYIFTSVILIHSSH